MVEISLFYSWQSDDVEARKCVTAAINKAIKKLRGEGIEVRLVQDSRTVNGSEEIPSGVLDGIELCDLFIADMTPVAAVPGTSKLQPNANVLFEYGYALRTKGARFTRLITRLTGEQEPSQLPFDINHRKLIIFSQSGDASLNSITSWLRDKTVEIQNERLQAIPTHAANISFAGGEAEITVHPRFRRVHFNLPESVPQNNPYLNPFSEAMRSFDKLSSSFAVCSQIAKPIRRKTNLSLLPLQLYVENIGNEAIENCNIRIWSENTEIRFERDNQESSIKSIYPLSLNDYRIDKTGAITRHFDAINAGEMFSVADTFVMLPKENCTLQLKWRYTSKSHRREGSLIIHSEPEYEEATRATEDVSLLGCTALEEIVVKE